MATIKESRSNTQQEMELKASSKYKQRTSFAAGEREKREESLANA